MGLVEYPPCLLNRSLFFIFCLFFLSSFNLLCGMVVLQKRGIEMARLVYKAFFQD